MAGPDGLTIGIAAVATHAINLWLCNKMPFNADTTRRLNVNTPADLIRYAEASPAKLNYGSGGNGNAGHLAGEMFKKVAFF